MKQSNQKQEAFEALRIASDSYDDACVAYDDAIRSRAPNFATFGKLLDEAWSLRQEASIAFDAAHAAHAAHKEHVLTATRRFSQA